MQKILVLRGGALGDFIVTLPALALLRQSWPAARIELAGNTTAAALALRTVGPPLAGGPLREHPVAQRQTPARLQANLLDAAHSQHEARWSALFGDTPLPFAFAEWLASFDLVLNFWPDDDSALRRRFPLRKGQVYLSAAAMPAAAPAAAHYCAALAPLGLATTDYCYPIGAHAPSDSRANALIALHPGSGSSRKNWPIERWTELCAWLEGEHQAKLLIVTGDAEAAGTLERYGTAARNLPLNELVARFGECRLFLGHDSGVSHLAAACGVPSVLLFGPTDPAIWAPPATHVRLLKRGPEMTSISVSDVQREVHSLLQVPRSPAFL